MTIFGWAGIGLANKGVIGLLLTPARLVPESQAPSGQAECMQHSIDWLTAFV